MVPDRARIQSYKHRIDGPYLSEEELSIFSWKRWSRSYVRKVKIEWYLYDHPINPKAHGINVIDRYPWFETSVDQMMWLQLAEKLKPRKGHTLRA